MYLRVQEKRYSVYFDDSNEIHLGKSKSYQNHYIDPYICLFDSNWNIVEEVWQYLQSRLQAKRLSFNTVKAKGNDLKLYYEFLEKYKILFISPTSKDIDDFVSWLFSNDENVDNIKLNVKSERTAKTVNRILSTLSDYYNYLDANKLIQNNPFSHNSILINKPSNKPNSIYQHTLSKKLPASTYKIKEFDKGIRVLNKDQIELILNNCKLDRDRLLFELLLLTGMRIGEALSLTIDSIGISNYSNDIQDLKMIPNNEDKSKGNNQRQQKSGVRDLFIPTKIMDKLNDYYMDTWLKIYEKKEMDHNYLFISEFHNTLGEPLSYQAVWNSCRKIGKKIGFLFTPHDFRHTYATVLAKNGIKMHELRKLLGHGSLSSTDVYLNIANKEDMVKELVPFFKKYGEIK